MRLRKTLSVLVIAGGLFVAVPQVSQAVSASAVTLNFMCPCGTCDEALSTCECPESDGYRAQIAGMVGRGYSEEQVIDDFKGRFGPDVLIANAAMAPSEGENVFNKRTIGFVFLLASISLVAFSLGRYMTPASSPSSGRRRSAPRPRKVSSTEAKSRKKREPGGEDEERFLEDHEI